MQHLFVLVDRLLGIAVVVGSIGARNVLLGKSCGQIQAGIDERRVEGDGLLEMIDGLFEFRVLISLHTLVEMVTRLKLGAAGAGEHHQRGGEYHQEPLSCFHCFMNLPLPRSVRTEPTRIGVSIVAPVVKSRFQKAAPEGARVKQHSRHARKHALIRTWLQLLL